MEAKVRDAGEFLGLSEMDLAEVERRLERHELENEVLKAAKRWWDLRILATVRSGDLMLAVDALIAYEAATGEESDGS